LQADLPYGPVATHTFPLDADERSPEERLLHELAYYLTALAVQSEAWERGEAANVELKHLLDFSSVAALCQDADEAK